ncbi:MAG TPA: glycosyltransferase family 2 protein [Verrucomicrobiae bacterium]|nr:glycosyltransferase family 2 protein [Verrucomicrobiae bacterium]
MPIISVIVLNYNGLPWLEKCLTSLRNQSFAEPFEIIFADNLSTDGSDKSCAELLRNVSNGRFIQNGVNLGFCEGNNRAAKAAAGRYFLFLNNDAWLEPDCLERLLAGTERAGAAAASPLILNYSDDSFQSIGAEGFDIFGLPSARLPKFESGRLLMPEGCAYFIRADVFWAVGAFDPEFFMYADEYDLSWRVWLAGHSAARVPEAKVHHRGAASVYPAGGGTVVENRTSDTKRYYANRNALLILLKNCHDLLLVTVLLQLLLFALEIVASFVLVRRWSFVKRAYLEAVADCFRMHKHLRAERAKIAGFRKRSDWWMLRFLTWRMNRWDELKRVILFGPPKVAPK